MDYTRIIYLDLNLMSEKISIKAKQNDIYSRFLKVVFMADGEPFALPEEITEVFFRCKRQDGKIINYSNNQSVPGEERSYVTLNSDGSVTIELSNEVLEKIGTALCDVCLNQENGSISTSEFTLSILPSPGAH